MEFHDVGFLIKKDYNMNNGVPRLRGRMVITFIGHRTINDIEQLGSRIENAILSVAPKDDKVIFYCGGYGEFDNLCARVCNNIRTKLFQ